MQIRITMRYHRTPVRKSVITKNTDNKYWCRCGKTGNPRSVLGGMEIAVAILKNSMEISQKTKNKTIIWPTNCTSVYIPPKHSKILIQKDTCNPMFIAALFIFAATWMHLDSIMLSETSQRDKDRYYMILIIRKV